MQFERTLGEYVLSELVLNPFSGGETEDIRTFKQLIRSTVSFAQVPEPAKLEYLKLHLTGGEAFYLEILEADRHV